jgi:pimeloyl-ACP methyl ester carboxylesterase
MRKYQLIMQLIIKASLKSLLALTGILFSIGISAQTATNYEFTELDISLKTQSGEIFGTLTIPNKLAKTTVVLIIAGSGPTDRNGNSVMGVKANSYKMISQELARRGISTVRYDKRGVGQSANAMVSEADLRFETYSNDAAEWVKFLKQDTRFTKVIIAGHSEGSLLGMLAAQQSECAAYISISGPGKSADKILEEQLRNKLPFQSILESNAILDSLRKGIRVAKVSPTLLSLYRPSVQPYMISWIKYDPSIEIKKLKMPVLILHGTTDIQVSTDDAKLLSAAKPDATLAIIKNMNHILKECDSFDDKNTALYTMPDVPLHKEVIEEMILFIQKN